LLLDFDTLKMWGLSHNFTILWAKCTLTIYSALSNRLLCLQLSVTVLSNRLRALGKAHSKKDRPSVSRTVYSNIYPTRCNVTQFILSGNCSTCFGWHHYPSLGTQTTVSTASGICHTVTDICCYRGRAGTGLSVLWVAYSTHSTLKPVPTLPRWRYIAVTVWQIPDAVDTVICILMMGDGTIRNM